MADIFFFLKQGWKILWQQNTIWLFSAAALFQPFLPIMRDLGETDSTLQCMYVLLAIPVSLLSLISLVGVPYIAYSFVTGQTVSAREALAAVKKFAWRVVGCSCLGLLVGLPFLFMFLDTSKQPPQLTPQGSVILLTAYGFAVIQDFTLFGFFANNWGIWQSLKNAWRQFVDHFAVLATLGLLVMMVSQIYTLGLSAILIFIQAGFEMDSLRQLDLINPYAGITEPAVFWLLDGFGQMVLMPFSALVFALAYRRYRHSQTRTVARFA